MSDSYWTKEYERHSIRRNEMVVCPHCGERWNIIEKDHDIFGNILWKCQVCKKEYSDERNTTKERSS